MNRIDGKCLFLICLLCSSFSVQSSALLPTKDQKVENLGNQEETLQQERFRTRLLVSGITLATTLYGFTSWWDKSSSEFRVRHEGWFEADSPNGGADKLGHGYSAYVATRFLTQGFQWAGHSRQHAAWLAGMTSGTLSLGVEVMDGFTEKYGFSTEDMVMNLSGIGLGVLFDAYPAWDDLFDIRFKYWTSDDAKRLHDYDPIADYSGQTYLLIAKAHYFPWFRENKFLRYLEFALGYGTRGYQPTDGTGLQTRERNLYYGISLNLSQLLNDWAFQPQDTHQTSRKVTEHLLEYLQMPGTALLFEHSF